MPDQPTPAPWTVEHLRLCAQQCREWGSPSKLHVPLRAKEVAKMLDYLADLLAALSLPLSQLDKAEVCICAAVKFADGRIIRGHHHDSCFVTANHINPRPPFGGHIQGFITSCNRFVTREEGAMLQNVAGIVSAHTGKPIMDILFSEDLYLGNNDPAVSVEIS